MSDFLRRVFCTDGPDEKPQPCWAGSNVSAGNNACVDLPRYGPADNGLFFLWCPDPTPRMATTDIGLCDEHYAEIFGGGEHEHPVRTP